jgi:hypothetical protein
MKNLLKALLFIFLGFAGLLIISLTAGVVYSILQGQKADTPLLTQVMPKRSRNPLNPSSRVRLEERYGERINAFFSEAFENASFITILQNQREALDDEAFTEDEKKRFLTDITLFETLVKNAMNEDKEKYLTKMKQTLSAAASEKDFYNTVKQDGLENAWLEDFFVMTQAMNTARSLLLLNKTTTLILTQAFPRIIENIYGDKDASPEALAERLGRWNMETSRDITEIILNPEASPGLRLAGVEEYTQDYAYSQTDTVYKITTFAFLDYIFTKLGLPVTQEIELYVYMRADEELKKDSRLSNINLAQNLVNELLESNGLKPLTGAKA